MRIRRYCALLLAATMLFVTTSFATATSPSIQFSTDYDIQGENVVETISFSNPANLVITRTIYPDGTFHCRATENGAALYDQFGSGTMDYTLYANVALGIAELVPYLSMTRSSDRDGRHYYYATYNYTIDENDLMDMNYLWSAGAGFTLAALLAGLGVVGIPAAIIGVIGGLLFNRLIGTDDVHEIRITQSNYEVRSWEEDIYLCHCAHVTSRLYYANGSLKEQFTEYYQSIGGI